MNNRHIRFISFILAGIMIIVSCIGCANETYSLKSAKELTRNLDNDENTDSHDGERDYTQNVDNSINFSIELFKRSVDNGNNCVVSPVSVMMSLGMTANGAAGDTMSQMLQVLGGGADIEELNDFYGYVLDSISSDESTSELSFANSLWIKNTLEDYVQDGFLETVAGKYDAQVFAAPFDDSTVDDVNSWIEYYTDGMIDGIMEEAEDNYIMYIINAVAFDAQWEVEYGEESISNGKFTDIDGSASNVNMMASVENKYISYDNVTGFIKPYDGGYSFVALLPDENTDINEFIDNLDGETFMELVDTADEKEVYASIPEFEISYAIDMSDAVKDMGITDAFTTDADFENMMDAAGPENVEIDSILHKTFISVNAEGTKAASGTDTVTDTRGAAVVCLDRPFVYAVIDDSTNLPVFIGTVTEL